MKAKATGFKMYGKHSTMVEYEYRGCKYEVEYANDWTFCVTPAYIQHKDAQDEINKAIDNPKIEKEAHPIDFDEIWRMLEWD